MLLWLFDQDMLDAGLPERAQVVYNGLEIGSFLRAIL